MSDNIYHEAVGRRKQSTARARVFVGGAGEFIVNDKNVDNYFRNVDKGRIVLFIKFV